MKPVCEPFKKASSFLPCIFITIVSSPSHIEIQFRMTSMVLFLGFFFFKQWYSKKNVNIWERAGTWSLGGKMTTIMAFKIAVTLSESHFSPATEPGFQSSLWSPESPAWFQPPCKSHLSTLRSATSLGNISKNNWVNKARCNLNASLKKNTFQGKKTTDLIV